MKITPHSPEALESRIAPAQLFLSGTAFDVVDQNGTSVNDTTSAGLVGADLAVLLKVGDTLILDTNGNHVLDTGEVVFAKVTGGKALVFAKNIDMDTTVDPDEMTSLAVSDGFKGAVDGNLRGSVVTSLPMSGAFDPTKLLDASIAGFTITGRMHGSILAGKNISNVQLETVDQGVAGFSAESLRCGTKANNQAVSYDGGATNSTPVFTFAKQGEAGGSISNVTITSGVFAVLAGAGNTNTAGHAGNGGSIAGLTFLHFRPTAPGVDLDVIAGAGGQSFGADGLPANPTGNGGKGGAVSKIQFESDYTGGGNIVFRAGAGGVGKKSGNGGAVTTGNYHFFNDSTLDVEIRGGDGGKDSGSTTVKAPGGKGGAVADQHFIAANKLGIIKFAGGNGYNATVNGTGGSGGAVSKIEVMALAGAQGFIIDAGDGGSGSGKAPGGKGGAVSALDLELGGITDDVQIFGGRGGSSPIKGGAGGAISGVTMTLGSAGNTLEVKGGVGGFGAKGAVGGGLSKITADLGPVQSYATFMAGNGAPSKSVVTTGLSGGAGGAVKNLTITDHGSLLGSGVSIVAGNGGSVFGGTGNGANGGSISNVVLKKTGGGLTENAVIAGAGGDGSGKGNGGNSGNISSVTYEGSAAASLLHIGANDTGGESGLSGLRGGKGTSVSKVTVKADAHPFTTGIFIDAGGGGEAKGSNGHGGNAGSVKTISLDVLGSAVRINANAVFGTVMEAGQAGTGAKAVGGTGGDVSGITGRAGLLVVDALTGGDSAGKGGRGGNISSVTLTAVTSFVRQIRAGDGGYAPKPGRGGNISSITVPGDIGDFTALFDTDHKATSGMGGLLAGQGGGSGMGPIDPHLNGSITGVSATRIAAILAGDANASSLENDNAVSKITKITATKIGAEPVLTPGFDFTDNDGDMTFQLGDDDTALDGLVIVLAGKSTLPVTPLKLIEV